MENVILVAILLVIVGLAAWYVIRAKKRGKTCIGCPDGCCTAKGSGSACCGGCGGETSAQDGRK